MKKIILLILIIFTTSAYTSQDYAKTLLKGFTKNSSGIYTGKMYNSKCNAYLTESEKSITCKYVFPKENAELVKMHYLYDTDAISRQEALNLNEPWITKIINSNPDLKYISITEYDKTFMLTTFVIIPNNCQITILIINK